MLVAQLDRDLQRDTGLPIACYELLALLSASPSESMRMTELAEATRSSPSRITHAIDRMAAQGWVERQDCAEDRRGCSASLTEVGRAALVEATTKHDAIVRAHLFDQLSPAQIDELGSISRSVLDHLYTVRSR